LSWIYSYIHIFIYEYEYNIGSLPSSVGPYTKLLSFEVSNVTISGKYYNIFAYINLWICEFVNLWIYYLIYLCLY